MTDGVRCLSLSLAKIRQATKGFQKILGKGGFGEVYYGKLADGREVAVKVLSAGSSQGNKEFYNEVGLVNSTMNTFCTKLLF